MLNGSRRFAVLLLTASALAGCASAQSQLARVPAGDPLAEGFADPAPDARPRTWWHWMNGNITKGGIAKDLAWMKSVGLGGVQTFDVSLDTPQVVDKRLVYMTPEWKDAFRFAAEETERLGLELTVATSPGWSETGGPWVRPEHAMKKLVWAQQVLTGGQRFTGRLALPPRITGPYQDLPVSDALMMGPAPAPPEASGRIAVLAVPVASPDLPPPDIALEGGARLDGTTLADGSYDQGVSIPLSTERRGLVKMTYPRAVTVRSARVFFPGLKSPFRGSPVAPVLEAKVGGEWRKLGEVAVDNVPTVMSFDAVTAREFRIVIAPVAEQSGASDLAGAPGAQEIDFFATGPLTKVDLVELALSGEPAVGAATQKAGFATALDYDAIADRSEVPAGVPAEDVIDLTDRMGEDGTLEWTPPAGRDWRVLSFGWSLTGKTNHPAPPEATGLEVDKFDAAAVRAYLEHYLATYRDAAGSLDEIDALLTDSIEAGLATWTPAMEAEFARRRGYALRPWLPALTGIVIGSRAETEKFLADWRRTLAEMLADNHYATVAAVAHENGLKVYGEALEDKRPLLGDDLAMRRHADIPMAALWTWPASETVRTTLLGDMKGAASVAHVWGKTYVAAESMTAVNSPWAFAPRDLKTFIDLEFALGINRPVIHTSVHQPLDDKQPGLSLAIFGQYFNRHETWAGMARPWIDYIARTGYMLQQGRYGADVAWFIGEEAPLTAQFAERVPDGLPTRYGYDFVDAEMLRDGLRAEDGRLVSSGGTQYRLIHLGEPARLMTLATLRRLAELADAGVLVSGHKPLGSPSLADDADAFAALAERVWNLPNVVDGFQPEEVLKARGIVSDHAWRGDNDADVRFVHRVLDDGDVYFVDNRRDETESGEACFRVTGRRPEWWDAITGAHRALTYRIENGVTCVPLDLAPLQAGFAVFRDAASQQSWTAPTITRTEVPVEFAPWQVSFQPGRGGPEGVLAMASLQPLDSSHDPRVRYFSGIATYRSSFSLHALPEGRLWLDLGKVGDVAQVAVNGRDAGIAWFDPNRVDVTDLVRRGKNTVEIRVANLWVNRLIGDAQPGADKIAFVTAPTYRPDAPLRPSGLIGPVTFSTER